ncbi:MAG: hypothetical protein RLZ98_548 [Pseudomonadota bacterium]|jgi:ABC-type transporter Mla subunit MlaD
MNIENEIQDLKRRVGELEGTVSVLTGKLSTLTPDLQAIQRQTNERFDAVETKFTRLIGRLDTINTQVWSLRDDLPDLISKAVQPNNPKQPD